MKRNDEIKIGLECCEKYMSGAPEEECCHMCNYAYNCAELIIDVLALIQQKEQENAEQAERIQQFEAQNDTIMQSFQRLKKVCVEQGTTIQQLEAERDAAMDGLRLYGGCDTCLHRDNKVWEEPCLYCEERERWEWRGVQKEGTK